MSTFNQSELDTTQAVFESNANNFTHSLLKRPATTTWESNVTKKVRKPNTYGNLRLTLLDRELFLEKAAAMSSGTSVASDSITANTSNRIAYINLTKSKLCGMPAFCSNQASTFCHNVTLNECEECSMTGAGIFAAVWVILGLLIVMGNGMVMCVIIKNHLNDGSSIMKVSLAISDALTGNINRLTIQKNSIKKQ